MDNTIQVIAATIFVLFLITFILIKRKNIILQKVLFPLIYLVLYRSNFGINFMNKVAKKYKATGWKVNGAGGKGGSLAILSNTEEGLKTKMLEEMKSLGRGIKSIPVSLETSGLKSKEKFVNQE